MGGPGSGRRWGRTAGRTTVEATAGLDVLELARGGFLRPGSRVLWGWTFSDGTRRMVHLEAKEQAFSVDDAPILLEWTPCRFGGARPWFRCPRCLRRTVKLHAFAGGAFACRTCLDVRYESQREAPDARARRRARKIRHDRLKGPWDFISPFPPKPRGMHWRTYSRLFKKASAAEAESLAALREYLAARHARLSSRRQIIEW